MNTFAQRLKLAIEYAKKHSPGMNQSVLAREIGVKPQAIQYLCREDGKKNKKSAYTADIARILKVNPEWLSTGHGEMEQKNTIFDELLKKQHSNPIDHDELFSDIPAPFERANDDAVSQRDFVKIMAIKAARKIKEKTGKYFTPEAEAKLQALIEKWLEIMLDILEADLSAEVPEFPSPYGEVDNLVDINEVRKYVQFKKQAANFEL